MVQLQIMLGKFLKRLPVSSQRDGESDKYVKKTKVASTEKTLQISAIIRFTFAKSIEFSYFFKPDTLLSVFKNYSVQRKKHWGIIDFDS